MASINIIYSWFCTLKHYKFVSYYKYNMNYFYIEEKQSYLFWLCLFCINPILFKKRLLIFFIV